MQWSFPLFWVRVQHGFQEIRWTRKSFENHLHVGEHSQVRRNSDTVYDKLRGDWAEKFRTVDKNEENRSVPVAVGEELHENSETGRSFQCSDLQTGWALHKPRNEAVRFPTEVKPVSYTHLTLPTKRIV